MAERHTDDDVWSAVGVLVAGQGLAPQQAVECLELTATLLDVSPVSVALFVEYYGVLPESALALGR